MGNVHLMRRRSLRSAGLPRLAVLSMTRQRLGASRCGGNGRPFQSPQPTRPPELPHWHISIGYSIRHTASVHIPVRRIEALPYAQPGLEAVENLPTSGRDMIAFPSSSAWLLAAGIVVFCSRGTGISRCECVRCWKRTWSLEFGINRTNLQFTWCSMILKYSLSSFFLRMRGFRLERKTRPMLR